MTNTQDIYLNSNQIETISENNLLNHALHYAKLGYPVFPLQNIVKRKNVFLCSCRDNQTCDTEGKHPRTPRGYKDATTNEQTIINWWTRHPKANIGIPTGIISGIFVLDVDTKYGGEYSLECLQEDYKTQLEDYYKPASETLTTISGSGGRHYYFKYDDRYEINNSASEIGAGLDIRGEGGYIVAPPSNHLSGREYAWFGVNTPIADSPNWLMYEILKADKQEEISTAKSNSVAHKIASGEVFKRGERHEHLWRFICGYMNSHSKEETLRRALEVNNQVFDFPFPEKTVVYQVNYLWNKYIGKKKNKDSDLGLKR